MSMLKTDNQYEKTPRKIRAFVMQPTPRTYPSLWLHLTPPTLDLMDTKNSYIKDFIIVIACFQCEIFSGFVW